MDNGSTLLNASADSPWLEPPPPKLLQELEPAHRVFLRNLADTLLRRQPPEIQILSRPGDFWRDVFVATGTPWWSLLESTLWHISALLVVIAISQNWMPHLELEKPWTRRTPITYYRPEPTFPAIGSRPPRGRAQAVPKMESPRALQVAREIKPSSRRLVAPPDIAALTKPKEMPALVDSPRVAPSMPLAAAPGSQKKAAELGVSAVAPPPDIQAGGASHSNALQVVVVAPAPALGSGHGQLRSGGTGISQPVVVAPAPGLTAVSGGRGVAVPAAGAVAPAPAFPGGSAGRVGHGEEGNLLHIVVVGPAPKLPTGGQGGMSGRVAHPGLSGTDAAVVPPPPSVQASGIRRGSGGGVSGSGSGLDVSGLSAVPPAPTIGGGGRLTGHGGGLTGSSGVGVIPPSPSVEGTGRSGGRGGALAGGSSLGVIPPSPSVNGTGRIGGRGGGFGDGAGNGVVPPPPSVDGADGLGGRGAGGISGDSLSAVPPAPSLEGGLGGRGNGDSLGTSGSAAVGPPPVMDGGGDSRAGQGLDSVVEELPMRIVGLAFSLPSTSFSSSYEVFIAEKELKGRKELIKLVYWFLPYQSRLSEYHPDASRMYKLRVTRDHACDESLAHMSISPTGQPYGGSHLSADALSTADPGMTLPCYRTTADDYLKAMSRKH